MSRFILKNDNFFSDAKKLRASFEEKFADPKAASSNRFVWDYWHVPGQYTQLRTPAYHYFPQATYKKLEQQLLHWGRRTLGCDGITPPWLSCYIDGCEQEIHSDVPHGPWAFVFSLTKWRQRKFKGGETFLLKPSVLDYWSNFVESEDRERDGFLDFVAPEFNRLTVFDPRFPHGVRRVSGVQDPMQGRLVIHGWFTEPKPFLEGALTAKQAAPILDEAVEKFAAELLRFGNWHGTLSLRLQVSAAGKLTGLSSLANTLLPLQADQGAVAKIQRSLKTAFHSIHFPRAKGKTEITLPLLFR